MSKELYYEKKYYGWDIESEFDDELSHVGVGHDDNPPGRGSGRYPFGSGKNPNQHLDFYQRVLNLRKEGLKDEEIRQMFDMNTSVYRAELSVGKTEYDKVMSVKAKELAGAKSDDGKKLYSNVEIAQMLGVTEGTIRNYLKRDDTSGTSSKITETMNLLRNQCNDKNYIDVGVGSEFWLGCSNQRMSNAARILHEVEGYELYNEIRINQMGTQHKTTFKVLAPPGTTKNEIYNNPDRIKLPEGTCEMWPPSGERGITVYGIKDPTSISSKRVSVRYAEDGGKDKDGVMEIRRGVDDLMMGSSSYAQVRIAVDGTHYLKGMAVYSDGKDMPDGVDIIFNTNKHKDVPMMGPKDNTVLKVLKNDKDNPFGATISRQIEYEDKDGKIILSPINIVNEEGSWGGDDGWSKNIASQMLSKQPAPLIKKQLGLSYADRVSEFDDIMLMENPVIKKKALEAFADNCDRTAVDLKASPFPGQSWKVILPIPSLKDNEIYAPTYNHGDRVILVRYPHGGTHEIPELVVNKENKEGKNILGNAVDAVGINPYVAGRLSGADFDGDTVLVIPANGPNSRVKIQTRLPFEGLDTFDPKESYPKVPGMKVMQEGEQKQREMGIISNLITDMTIKGAPDKEIAKAIKHSMVVIDAPKHELNYIQSYKDNEIEKLKKDWQKKYDEKGNVIGYGGASTLLSKAKGVVYVNERKEGDFITDPKTGKTIRYMYDPKTGEKLYSETGRLIKRALVDEKEPYVKDSDGAYVKDKSGKKQKNYILDDNGKKIYVYTDEKAKQESTQMAETKDARKLSSGTKQEELYADYANKLKALANEARKASMVQQSMKRTSEAAEKYKDEVESLNAKLLIALKNAPRERQAQLLANYNFKAKKEEHPDMTKDDEKKYRNQALNAAREIVGANKYRFNGYGDQDSSKKKGLRITEKEWEAIQAGAISNAMFSKIVDNAEIDYLKRLSSPRQQKALSSAKIAKIKAMSRSGFTLKEIADQMNVSTNTIAKYLKSEE